MDETVTAVIDDVVARAEAHDADEPDRLRRWRVLEPDAGRLLWFLAASSGARDVVEIGTSHGVSTLWLGGVLVVDNALSHADEVAPLAALIDEHPDLTSTTVAVGKGELLALRSR